MKETQILRIHEGSEKTYCVRFRGLKQHEHFLIGHAVCKPNYYCFFSSPAHYCFMFFVKGKGKLRLGHRRFSPKANELYLYRPGEEWEYETDPDDPWEIYWLNVSFPFSLSLLKLYDLDEPFSVDFPATLSHLSRLFELASRIGYGDTETYDAFLRSFVKFVQEVSHIVHISNESKQLRDLRIMCEYIHNHIMENIKIGDVANLVFRSTSGAGLLFRKAYGCSIKEYILREKFEVAASLLADTRIPVSQVASDLSFCDAQHFSQLFTQRFGMSPLRYRHSLQTEKVNK